MMWKFHSETDMSHYEKLFYLKLYLCTEKQLWRVSPLLIGFNIQTSRSTESVVRMHLHYQLIFHLASGEYAVLFEVLKEQNMAAR